MPGPPPRDWSGNPEAKANRAVKIERIVAWCWEHGYDPEVAEPATRNRIIRQVGYSKASDETWEGVVTSYLRERDVRWLERALAEDSPASRILAAAAEKRAAHHATGTPNRDPAT